MSTDNEPVLGALPPPAGVTPDFQNPKSIIGAVTSFNIFLMVLISVTTFIRLYTRIWIIKKVSWADYSMIFAYCAFITYFSILLQAWKFPAAGRHQWNVLITTMPDFNYWIWVCQWFYSISVTSIRVSICLQFADIFVVGRTRRFWVLAAFICVNVTFYIAILFAKAFQCTPVAKTWKPHLEGSCMVEAIQHIFIAASALNLAGDIFMIAYPLYFIRGLNTSKHRRIALGALFMVGVLGAAASLLRVVFSVRNVNNPDQTYTLTQVAECTFSEVSAGMIAANLISLPGFLVFSTGKFKGWMTTHGSRDPDTSRHGSYDDGSTYKNGISSLRLNRMDSAQHSEQNATTKKNSSGDFAEQLSLTEDGAAAKVVMSEAYIGEYSGRTEMNPNPSTHITI